MGYPGDVVNKARLYDQCAQQPDTALGAKVIRCMVDYSTKTEKLLKELRALLQPTGVQPERELTPTPTQGSTLIPFPNTSPDMVTPPVDRPDPKLQEEISEINTEDIVSLKTWAVEGAENMTTPTTGSRGTNLLATYRHPDQSAKKRGGGRRSEQKGEWRS